MGAVWCPACTRRLPEGTERQCPYCYHVGVVRGGEGVLRSIGEATAAVLSVVLPFVAGLASGPYAIFGGLFLMWPNPPMVFCALGAAFGGVFAPASLLRSIVLIAVGYLAVAAPIVLSGVAGDQVVFVIPFLLLSAASTSFASIPGVLVGAGVGRLIAKLVRPSR